MKHTRGFSLTYVIWDSIRSAEAQKPCALPRQETPRRQPSSLTPELCLHGISSLACLSRKASPTFTETRKFADLEDIIKLNWLPVKEIVEFNLLKLAHKSLYDKDSFPEYLKLNLHQVTAYNLRTVPTN